MQLIQLVVTKHANEDVAGIQVEKSVVTFKVKFGLQVIQLYEFLQVKQSLGQPTQVFVIVK